MGIAGPQLACESVHVCAGVWRPEEGTDPLELELQLPNVSHGT